MNASLRGLIQYVPRGTDVIDAPIGVRQQEIVEYVGRNCEKGCAPRIFVANVVAVESIKTAEAISFCQEIGFPVERGGRDAVGFRRFDHQNARSHTHERVGHQDRRLRTLDVDLEEVDGPLVEMALEQIGQAQGVDRDHRPCNTPARRMLMRDILDGGRETVQEVEMQGPRLTTYGDGQVEIVGTLGSQQILKSRVGLDIDPGPALTVEPLRDVVDDGVEGADIDVETARDVGQGTAQQHVLEVLRVADHRRQNAALRPIRRDRGGGRCGLDAARRAGLPHRRRGTSVSALPGCHVSASPVRNSSVRRARRTVPGSSRDSRRRSFVQSVSPYSPAPCARLPVC